MAENTTPVLHCPKCKVVLPPEVFNTPELTSCPFCSAGMHASVFPAFCKGIGKGQSGDLLLDNENASCFYHSSKKAATTCENCGRFLCSLCDVVLQNRHLCPGCIEKGKGKGKLKNINKGQFLYDDMALALAILPLLFWPSTIITALITIYVAIRYWKTPLSVLPRTKIRFVFAILIASLEIIGWSSFFIMISR
ncbi:hypothetical protein ACFLS1_08460 [Verrucomicrobiota bacterium]